MDQPDYNRAKIIIICVIAALVIAAIFAYRDFRESRGFRVIFFNVGQGDSALIRLPSGEKILIDCGPDNTILRKLGRYLNFFDRELDYLVITHPDRDHYGGCIELLKRYRVKQIFENGDSEEAGEYWPAWLKAADAEGAERTVITSETKIVDGEAIIMFYAPTVRPEIAAKDNNKSIVARLVYGTTSFFFSGDIEAEREVELAESLCPATGQCPALKSDYLKVAHHGSDGSFEEHFFRAVLPSFAVIPVGRNSFGHPSLRIIRNLERIGASVWRTDELGDIIIR